MTPIEHASAEQVADLLEGNLPAAKAMRINAHLTGCGDCRDLRDALVDVAAVLGAEGASAQPMPSDVAASLHEAIAAANAETRESFVEVVGAVRRPSPRTPWTWLAGAAAAVVVVAAGVAGVRALPQGGGSADSAASESQVQGRAAAGTPTPVPGSGAAAQHRGSSQSRATLTPLPSSTPFSAVGPEVVRPDSVAAAARRLSTSSNDTWASLHGRCATPLGSGHFAVVQWLGRPAVLDAEPGTRTATILDCRTARTVLYTTGY